MRVKFNNGTEKQIITNPVEQKLFRNGESIGWVLNMAISPIESKEADSLLTTENIQNISLIIDDTNDTERIDILGYERVSALTIRHTDTKTVAEIQLSKGV